MDKIKKKICKIFMLIKIFMFINMNKIWAELDLNQRRHCQRIYSPSPLTTRASTQKKKKKKNNKVIS